MFVVTAAARVQLQRLMRTKVSLVYSFVRDKHRWLAASGDAGGSACYTLNTELEAETVYMPLISPNST